MSSTTSTQSSRLLGQKRLVLTLTTGRSGTETLARALGAWRDVTSRHEPKPTFGSAFRTVQAAPHTAREFWLEHKLPRIARSKRPIYAETSHLVCKGFLESLLELGGRPDLIRLERPAREVACSLFALNTIPGRTYKGVKYYLGPRDRDLLRPLEGPLEELHDYQLAYWYALVLAARADLMLERARQLGLRTVHLKTADLSSVDQLLALGERLELGPLGLRGAQRLRKVSARPWNTKRDKKGRSAPAPDELERLEQAIRTRAGA